MTGLVVTLGDSITWGTGPEDGKIWHRYINNRSASEWRSYAVGGFTMQAPPVAAATLAPMSAGYSDPVLLIYLGINDISGGRTGAQLFGDMDAYRATVMAAATPWKVVACTLPDSPTNNAQALDFSARLQASVNFSAIADLHSVLNDHTNSTYFDTDGIHLKSAGAAVVGGLVDTAMGGI